MEVLKNKRFRKKKTGKRYFHIDFEFLPVFPLSRWVWMFTFYFPRSGLKVRGGVTHLPTPIPSFHFRSPLGILLTMLAHWSSHIFSSENWKYRTWPSVISTDALNTFCWRQWTARLILREKCFETPIWQKPIKQDRNSGQLLRSC